MLTMALFVALAAMAETPEIPTINKLPTGVAPVMDGVVDDIWNKIPAIEMEQDNGIPTLNHARWRMTWNDEAIFVMVDIDDDKHCDLWCTGLTDWQSDRSEIFFNVSGILESTTLITGAMNDAPGGFGPKHGYYQFTSTYVEGATEVVDAQVQQWPDMVNTWQGYKIVGDAHIYEWKIPLTSLRKVVDTTDVPLAITDGLEIGFEILHKDVDDADNGTRRWWSSTSDGWADIYGIGEEVTPIGRVKFSSFTVSVPSMTTNFGKLAIYPNPASEVISIKVAAAAEVSIIDVTGRVVATQRVTAGETQINIGRLNKGLYFVKANGFTGKFIKK